MRRTHAPAAALRRTLRLLLTVMLLGLLAAQETVNTEYMSHAPHRTDLPPECAQVYGLLERCRARVAGRNIVQRAFNALGYGGCGGLEAKVLSCARQYRDGVVDAPPHADSSHGQFSGDWARSEPEQLRAPPRRSRLSRPSSSPSLSPSVSWSLTSWLSLSASSSCLRAPARLPPLPVPSDSLSL